MLRFFVVICPKCGNRQKMYILKGFPKGHVKKCVFCGKSFVIHSNPQDTCIIKDLGCGCKRNNLFS